MGLIIRLFIDAVFAHLRQVAKRELGLARLEDAQPGAICVPHRAGSALNLHPHLHAIVTDGVFVTEADGRPRFRALPAPSKAEVAQVAWSVCQQTVALLRTRGQWVDADPSEADRLARQEPLLASLAQASIAGTLVMGENAGKRVMRLFGAAAREQEGHGDDKAPKNAYGFDLHAHSRVPAADRRRLERWCRYLARPPLSNERLSLLEDGQYRVELKSPWSDGTSAMVLPGVELVARRAALVPAPRVHLVRYFGVFAPRAKLRALIVPQPEPKTPAPGRTDADEPKSKQRRRSWAALMKRVWALDVQECPRCHGRLQHMAVLTDARVITAMVAAIDKATGPPPPPLARRTA